MNISGIVFMLISAIKIVCMVFYISLGMRLQILDQLRMQVKHQLRLKKKGMRATDIVGMAMSIQESPIRQQGPQLNQLTMIEGFNRILL